jgi:hypothetical protein
MCLLLSLKLCHKLALASELILQLFELLLQRCYELDLLLARLGTQPFVLGLLQLFGSNLELLA